jgi:hypothetical protein
MNPPEVRSFAKETRDGFKAKANHNKNESLGLFITILVCSLSAPLFISYGDEIKLWHEAVPSLWAKIVPSVLSVIAAGLTSWIQLRKPQKLWSMYRNAQRLIEDEMTKHQFKAGDYKGYDTPDSLLAERVAGIALKAHNEWTAVVPSPEGAFNPASTTTTTKQSE